MTLTIQEHSVNFSAPLRLPNPSPASAKSRSVPRVGSEAEETVNCVRSAASSQDLETFELLILPWLEDGLRRPNHP